MRLLGALLAVAAVSWVLPAIAAASSTYTLAGIEVSANPATFVGSVTNQFGTWTATVFHAPLNYTGTTTITSGSFTITTFLPAGKATGTIDGGTITAGPANPLDGLGCTQTFTLDGTLNGGAGSYSGLLTHYGLLSGGRCNAFAASFRGQATI
jgi:hypothetical protein